MSNLRFLGHKSPLVYEKMQLELYLKRMKSQKTSQLITFAILAITIIGAVGLAIMLPVAFAKLLGSFIHS